MSAAGAWALLVLLVLVALAVADCFRQAPPETRLPQLPHLVPCPGYRCPWLLAPGETCPEHGTHTPLRLGAVHR